MAFTNTWSDTVPPDTAQASLGASNMRTIRVDVEQRLQQALCGLSSAIPTTLEAVFAGAQAGMPFYATDQHKIYQAVAANTYAEVATLNQWYIDTTINSYNASGVTLNTVTIPAGFLTAPPYLIEIDGFINANNTLTAVMALKFGNVTIVSQALTSSGGTLLVRFNGRVYVPAVSIETVFGDLTAYFGASPASPLYKPAAPTAAAQVTTGAIPITTQCVSGSVGSVQGGWLVAKILK